MRKLAVLRMNDSEPCPFGLEIPVACHRAGDTTLKMAPLEVLGDQATEEEIIKLIQSNQKLMEKTTNNLPCYFANQMVKNNAVDCTFGQPNAGDMGGGALRPSNYYAKPFSGTGTDGLYSFPRGYYSETSLDRASYYGPYSIEGIANKKELSHMVTTAQLNLDGVSVVVKKPDTNDVMEVSLDDDQAPEMVFEVVEEPQDQFQFKLPHVPGGDFQDEIQPAIEVDEPRDVEVVNDPWKWEVKKFLPWLQNKMQNVPKHTGKDSAGIERAISYLKFLNKEISRAVQMDLNNDIAIEAVEAAREEIFKGIERLEARLAQVEGVKFKRKKKGETEEQLTKEAQRTAVSGQGVQVVVPLLISSLARSCINGTVSAGHDMNVSYKKMVKEYSLTKREQLELQQLISDMGFPVRRDFGVPIDEPTNTRSSDNINFPANFPG